MANARKLNDFDKACAMLACELKDTHTTFYGFKTNLYGFGEGIYDDGVLPIDVKLIGDELFITKFLTAEAVNMGLQIGDCITHVNGRSISTIRQEKMTDIYSLLMIMLKQPISFTQHFMEIL